MTPGLLVSGAFFYHQRQVEAHAAMHDTALQDDLLALCGRICGTSLARLGASSTERRVFRNAPSAQVRTTSIVDRVGSAAYARRGRHGPQPHAGRRGASR